MNDLFDYEKLNKKEKAAYDRMDPENRKKFELLWTRQKQAQNLLKQQMQKSSAEMRKKRTHRLIERGAILESMLSNPEQYANEEVKQLLEYAFSKIPDHEMIRRF